MKKNEYSKVALSQEAMDCLSQLHNTLVAKQYAKRTIRNYMQEMRFLFAHYYDVVPSSINQQDIINYINFIINEHGVGREKCHQSLPRTAGRGGTVLQFFLQICISIAVHCSFCLLSTQVA